MHYNRKLKSTICKLAKFSAIFIAVALLVALMLSFHVTSLFLHMGVNEFVLGLAIVVVVISGLLWYGVDSTNG